MKAIPIWFIAALFSVSCAATGQVLLKLGVTSVRLPADSLLRPLSLVAALMNPIIIAGIGFFAFGTVLWLAAISGQRLSTVYPLAALGYILVTIASVKIFHDPITPAKIIGIILIITGISVIQLPCFQSSALASQATIKEHTP